MSLYFDPDFDAETKAMVREEFCRALLTYPDWAVQRAFDAWCRSMQRRPSPGEIVILVSRELKPLSDELAWRKKMADAQAAEQAVLTPEEMAHRREFAQGVMAQCGYRTGQTFATSDGPRRATVTDEDRAEMAAMIGAAK